MGAVKSLLPLFLLSFGPFVAGCGGASATFGLFEDAGGGGGDDAGSGCCPTCFCPQPPVDAGAPPVDAAHGKDTGATSDFVCGDASSDSYLVCNPATQYCSQVTQPHHSSTTYTCQSVPAACSQDVTCDCIMQAVGVPSCEQSNGQVTVIE
jgi:hypothetical protein